MFRTADNRALRIYTTTIPTEHRIPTLMHDPQYRLSIAWQNVAYNQPPHTGFYLGEGMEPPPRPASPHHGPRAEIWLTRKRTATLYEVTHRKEERGQTPFVRSTLRAVPASGTRERPPFS